MSYNAWTTLKQNLRARTFKIAQSGRTVLSIIVAEKVFLEQKKFLALFSYLPITLNRLDEISNTSVSCVIGQLTMQSNWPT